MVSSVLAAAVWFSGDPFSCGQTSQASLMEATMHQSGHIARAASKQVNDSFLL